MTDDNIKSQTIKNINNTIRKPTERPPADPDLSDHYQRNPSPTPIEKREKS